MTELLAPAGNMEALIAAIANGCDAVYLGMQKFGARAYSDNFDIETLKEVTNQKLGDDCDSTPEEDAMLLSDRNRAWMEQMPKMLADAPTLVVVGAVHLVGDEGLLSLLRQSGYTVDPVDKR